MSVSLPIQLVRQDPVAFACKLALSGLLCYASWLGVAHYRNQLKIQRAIEPYAATTLKPAAPNANASRAPAPWPHFPGVRTSGAMPAVFNDFRFMSDNFTAPAGAREVTDFYRGAMIARGWKDVTEDSLGLNPKALNCAGHAANLQNEDYLRNYDSVRSTQLVLVRGRERIQVNAQPLKDHPGQSHVVLTHSGQQDVFEMAQQISDRYQRARTAYHPRDVWKTREVIGKDLYETRMLASRQAPREASAALISEMQKEGWNPVFSSSHTPRSGAPGLTYLARGGDFALLTVNRDGKGRSARGTTAMLATVVDAPKHP